MNRIFNVCMFVICSLLLLSSCDKESNSIDIFYDYKVKNQEGFDIYSIILCPYNEDTTFLTGIKNEKMWVGMFDEHTKEQLKEWNGTETIERTIKIDLGYGKTELLNIVSFGSKLGIYKTNWGYIPTLTYGVILPTLGGGTALEKDILLLNDDKMIVYSAVNPSIIQSHWYQESIVVSSYIRDSYSYKVVSPEGKEIVELKSKPYNRLIELENLFPVSYTDGIGFYERGRGYDNKKCDIYIHRVNYAISKDLWDIPISSLTNIEKDALFNITILEQSNPIWKFQIDITNYDGSKKQVIFTVDVETGKVTEI